MYTEYNRPAMRTLAQGISAPADEPSHGILV
jgi:hypothetical protein